MGDGFTFLGFVIFVGLAARPLYDSHRMARWDERPAEVLKAWLEIDRSAENGQEASAREHLRCQHRQGSERNYGTCAKRDYAARCAGQCR